MDIALPPLAVAALFLLKATGVLLLTGASALVLRRSSAGSALAKSAANQSARWSFQCASSRSGSAAIARS